MIDGQIHDRLQRLISVTFSAPVETLNAGTRATDVAGWDSLGHMVLVSGVNREFGIKLPLRASMEARSIAELAGLIGQTAGGGH